MKTMQTMGALGVALLVGGSFGARAQLFSIDPSSPSTGLGISPADILAPGPPGGPPVVVIPGSGFGLVAGDDLDALWVPGPAGGAPLFSVDAASVGLSVPFPPNVFTQAGLGQAAGDIFATPPFPGGPVNSLALNQDALGLLPAVSPGTLATPPIDNLDALDMRTIADLFASGIAFSLTSSSPSLVMGGFSGADIFFIGPGGFGFLPASEFGLLPGDDIDAFDGDFGPEFSLAPGSPSLGALSPADILTYDSLGMALVPLFGPSAGTLGLAAGDNVDGWAYSYVPEPSQWAPLAGLGLVAWCIGRRKPNRTID